MRQQINFSAITGYLESSRLLLFIALCFAFPAAGQTIDFMRLAQSPGNDFSYSSAIAADGSIYQSGFIESPAAIHGTAQTGFGNTDAFLAKYNPQGDFQWAITAGGTGPDSGIGILGDAEGNVFWTGSVNYSGTLAGHNIGAGPNYYTVNFICKINAVGQVQWVRSIPNSFAHLDKIAPVRVNPDKSVDVVGILNSQVMLNLDGQVLSTGINRVIYSTRFSSSGTCLQITPLIASNHLQNDLRLSDAAGEPDGTLYVTGSLFGSATFENTPLSTIGPQRHIYLAKFTPSGSLSWAHIFQDGIQNQSCLTMDKYGRLLMAGSFTDTLTVSGHQLLSSSIGQGFIACFDTAGTVQWIKKYGGMGGTSFQSICYSPLDKIIVCGFAVPYFVTQPPLTVLDTVVLNGFGSHDGIIAGLDTLGDVEWAMSFGGPLQDGAFSCSADSFGRILISGSFRSTAAFGPYTYTSAGESDAFMMRISPPGVNVSAAGPLEASQLFVYPNPTSGIFRLKLPESINGPISLKLFDSLGRLVHEETPTTGSAELLVQPARLTHGLYLLQISDSIYTWHSRVVIER